jgi:hypothetical protein
MSGTVTLTMTRSAWPGRSVDAPQVVGELIFSESPLRAICCLVRI